VTWVLSPDYKQLMSEVEQGRQNIKWVRGHCVAGTPPAQPIKK